MNRGIQFSISSQLYHKDPQQTVYGKRLLEHSIEVMYELGFESFTFKKLAQAMKSTEASIYRYFENKHKLLIYLNCWYWEWVHYLIDLHTMNVDDAQKKIKIAIHELLNASNQSSMTAYINESLLHEIVVIEGVKAFHFHEVDQENDHGAFRSRKELIEKIAALILEVNPDFKYSKSLASTISDMADNQIYYAAHLPRLSSVKGDDKLKQIEAMINQFTFSILGIH